MEFIGVHEENMDINMTPSERASNFTNTEIEKLKKLISRYSKVLLNKKTNGLSIKQKDETWEVLAKEFNASNNTYRSVKQLKCKWEYMKKSARKEAGKVNRMRRQTGGGPPPPALSTTDEWVAGILKESATGLDSQYDGDVYSSIVLEPPPTSVYATVVCDDVIDISTDVVEVTDITQNVEQPSTPVSSTNRPRKVLSATPHHTRQSFLELARKKKELVEIKTKKIESEYESTSTLVHLREEKCRIEMDLLRKAFENDEKRKQELHELQVLKIKLEIDILSNKTK